MAGTSAGTQNPNERCAGWLAGGISGVQLDDCACGLVLPPVSDEGRRLCPLAFGGGGAHLLVCSDLSCSTISGDLGGDLTQLVAERPCVLSGGPRGSCRCRGSGPACHGIALLSISVLGVLLA